MSFEFVTSHIEDPEAVASPYSRFWVSYQTMGVVVGVLEVLSIISASILAQTLYQHFWLGQHRLLEVATGIGLLAALIHISFARSAELYRLPYILQPLRHMGKFFVIWGLGLLVLTAILFLLKEASSQSRGSFLVFGLLELPFLLTTRFATAIAIRSMIARGAIAGRPAVVIGDAAELRYLSSSNLLHQFGLKEVGRALIDTGDATDGKKELCIHVLQEAISLARRVRAEEFVVAVEWCRSDLLHNINDVLRNTPLPVRLLPDRVVRSTLGDRRADTSIGPTITVEMQRAPMTVAERILKRAVDLFLASIAVVMLAPLLTLSALAIKLDSPGPIIFRQRRNGFNEHQFTIYKFRTMRVLEDGDDVVQAKRSDPRVTRVGLILRRTSIDELPQLINVLKGDMSLVGPRPHAIAHDDQYKRVIETYCCRHHVKPGLTGWAQVNGLRGETEHLEHMQKRVEFDLWYINNWSLGLDIQIMVRTGFELLRQDAY